MGTFEDIAKKALTAHENKMAEEQQKQRKEADELERWASAAIAALEENVRPLLDTAQGEFARQKIRVTIQDYFDIRNRAIKVKPALAVQCLGPKRASDGYQFQGPKAFFLSDGVSIQSGIAENSFDREPKHMVRTAPMAEVESVVSQTLEQLLEQHFKWVRDNEHTFRLDVRP